MKVYQFVHTLNYGDAISGEAITISKMLNMMGYENAIYCVHAHPKVKHLASNIKTFENDFVTKNSCPEVVILLHYSIASPLNEIFCNISGTKKAVIYHNLTPSKWFRGYNTRVFDDLEKGREELPELLKLADLIIADSTFNSQEIEPFSSIVLPLPLDTEKWNVTPNAGISNLLKSSNLKNILHVGRIAPNKCIEDIIKAFYFYHHKIEPKSKLWLIGIDIDTEIYSFELRRLISKLSLKEAVTFVGSVSDCELRAFYENSQVYLCMSEHEGFCLPLVEAMHFGLPVIAYNSCAVTETVGEGGVLLLDKNPSLIAELIHRVICDTELNSELVTKGQERAKSFSNEEFACALEKALKLLFTEGEEKLRLVRDA
jgi:L-malate glycosyltransferase